MIKSRDAFDERERDKLSFDYLYSGDFLFIDSAQIKFYQQESESKQMMNEIRQGRTGSATRFRYSEFQQEIDGVYAQLGSVFEVGSSAHTLTYGVDYYTTYSESTRNGGTTDSYGVPVRERSVFPTRDFPITEVDHLAFFIQDEIELMDGKLRLIPGVRYDDFEADAVADSPYVKGNVGLPAPQDYEDSEVTASLGVIYFLEDGISLFGRYSEGFRAPPYDDVNQGFINLAGGYKAAPNPNLTSETSTGFELGVRLDDEYMGLELSIFRNEYEDFIEPNAIAPEFLRSGGIDPSDGLLTFQAVNLSEVEIDGVEVSGTVDLAMFSKGFSADQDYLLDDFSVRFAIAYADGEDVSAGQPLDSVEPLTGVIGLAYDSPAGNWGARLNFSMVQGKSPEDIAEGSVRPETAGYGVFDLLAYMNVADQVMVNVGLFNLGDKQYIRWSATCNRSMHRYYHQYTKYSEDTSRVLSINWCSKKEAVSMESLMAKHLSFTNPPNPHTLHWGIAAPAWGVRSGDIQGEFAHFVGYADMKAALADQKDIATEGGWKQRRDYFNSYADCSGENLRKFDIANMPAP